jgi:hypothetical protein
MKTRKKGAIVVAVALIVMLAKPQIAFAQVTGGPIRGSWEGLKAVAPGDELAVGLRNGQTLKGRMSSVSDTILTLAQGNKTTDFNRGDVLRVHRLISKSAKRATMIGLGIGAGLGGVSGGVAAASGPGESNEYGYGVLAVGLIGAGVGALTGYLIGSRKQRVLIYETR